VSSSSTAYAMKRVGWPPKKTTPADLFTT
jgi:hypothetical protein